MKLVCLHDSLFAADNGWGTPGVLTYLAAQAPGVTVTYLSDVLPTLEYWTSHTGDITAEFNAAGDVLLITVGHHDLPSEGSRTPTEMLADLDTIIAAASGAGFAIAVATIPHEQHWITHSNLADVLTYNAGLRTRVGDTIDYLVDTAALVPLDQNSVPFFRIDTDDGGAEYSPHGLHYSAYTNQKIILPVILDMLNVLDSIGTSGKKVDLQFSTSDPTVDGAGNTWTNNGSVACSGGQATFDGSTQYLNATPSWSPAAQFFRGRVKVNSNDFSQDREVFTQFSPGASTDSVWTTYFANLGDGTAKLLFAVTATPPWIIYTVDIDDDQFSPASQVVFETGTDYTIDFWIDPTGNSGTPLMSISVDGQLPQSNIKTDGTIQAFSALTTDNDVPLIVGGGEGDADGNPPTTFWSGTVDSVEAWIAAAPRTLTTGSMFGSRFIKGRA